MVIEKKKTFLLRNKTFTFLLPMLGETVKNFLNVSACFISDKEKPNIKNKIFVLIKTTHSFYEELHEWLITNESFNGFYNVNEDYGMYVFNIPEKWKKNYFLFLQGKYSLMEDTYKNHIIHFHLSNRSKFTDNSDIEKVKQVLYKDELLYLKLENLLDVKIPRSQEIGSIYNIEKEEFNLNLLN